MPAPSPELLERLRRSIDFYLDRAGNFWIDDEPVTHPRVSATLRRGLDRSERGEPTVHLGDQWCYLRVDDCFFRVLGIRGGDDRIDLDLDDGRRLPLDPTTLWEEPGQGLRCAVPAAGSGRPLSARFTNSAQLELAAHIDLEAEPRPQLRLGGRTWTIPETSGEP